MHPCHGAYCSTHSPAHVHIFPFRGIGNVQLVLNGRGAIKTPPLPIE